MSIQSEISRIQTARNTLRTKAVSLGVGLSTDDLTALATKYNAIVDRGTPNASVKEGESVTLSEGYYHGGTIQGVAGGGNYSLQSKTVTPTKSEQGIKSDDGYYGLSSVTVNPIPDAYQDVTSVTTIAADVLAGDIFVDALGAVKTGTMVNNGAVTKTLDTSTTSYSIPTGYHNGSGKVSITTETKSATPTTKSQTISPTSGKVLSSVIVDAIPSKYADISGVTVSDSNEILEGKTVIGYDASTESGVLITGTMTNNGAVNATLGSRYESYTTSYTIPEGYHDGTGTVSITLLEKTCTPQEYIQYIDADYDAGESGCALKQVTVNPIPIAYGNATNKTATNANILSGKTAIGWDSANKKAISLTGTMTDNGAVAPTALAAGSSYTIPVGYHNGSGKVTTQTLASQTGVDEGKDAITASTILTGYQGWVNGSKISGSMANNGAISGTITGLGSVTGDTSYTIPAGYTTGGTISITSDIEEALAAI